MDCSELRSLLLSGGALRGPEVEAHVAECAPCAELVRDDGALGRFLPVRQAPEPRIEAMLGDLHARLAKNRGFAELLRESRTALRVGLALAGVAALALAHLAWSRRADFAVYPAPALLVAVGSSCLLLGALLAIGLRPLQRALSPRWQRYALTAAALALPVILAARPQAHLDHPLSVAGTGADFLPRAAACFSYGSLLAIPLVVLCWALDRGEHRSLPNALLAAAAAGIGANLALELHCPITHPLHLLAGHASVGLALVVGYALFSAVRARST
jgi:hypothetical protein